MAITSDRSIQSESVLKIFRHGAGNVSIESNNFINLYVNLCIGYKFLRIEAANEFS